MNPSRYRLIVTSGPTREWIDPVRFISNPSSGRTGWAIARKGSKLFRDVVFISGPAHNRYTKVEGAKNIRVESTEEMAAAVTEAIREKTLLIMAAAPADFTPEKRDTTKIKRSGGELVLRLKPTKDILRGLDSLQVKDFIKVGFAAETDHIEENAFEKLKRKNLDFICANRVFQEREGFGENKNTLHVIGRDGTDKTIGPADKLLLAERLLQYLVKAID